MDRVFLCGSGNRVLPWMRVLAWRTLLTPFDWSIRGPADDFWQNAHLGPTASNQYVWLRSELPGFRVVPADWNHDNRCQLVTGSPFWFHWSAAWGWKVDR